LADSNESLQAAVAAARAAADKQGERIVVLDVRELIVITDFFVLCSGGSDRQVKTLIDAVEDSLRGLERRPIRREGETEAGWMLLDYVDVVVHVFSEEQRDYYDLERLWSDAPRVSWEAADAASG
jgi:ribosome-associated protein